MCPTLITLWLAVFNLTPAKARSRRRPAFRRPLVEGLEDRAVPCAASLSSPMCDPWALRQGQVDASSLLRMTCANRVIAGGS
jgi:hypothetical protein